MPLPVRCCHPRRALGGARWVPPWPRRPSGPRFPIKTPATQRQKVMVCYGFHKSLFSSWSVRGMVFGHGWLWGALRRVRTAPRAAVGVFLARSQRQMVMVCSGLESHRFPSLGLCRPPDAGFAAAGDFHPVCLGGHACFLKVSRKGPGAERRCCDCRDTGARWAATGASRPVVRPRYSRDCVAPDASGWITPCRN